MTRKHTNGRFGLHFVQTARQARASGDVRPWGRTPPPPADSGAAGPDGMLHHLGSLVDSVTTGILSLDGEGRIKVFNTAAEKLFGLPRVMVVGRHMNEIGRIMGFDDHSPRALWERLSDAVWAAGAALDLEYDLLQKNGHRRVISYSVYPLGRMAWSVGNGVVIMLEDVTRKKEMEEQISEARKRLLAVFDGITDGIQVINEDFRITAVNKSMRTLLARDIRLGAPCYEACAFGATICANCPAEETFRTGQPASLTKTLQRETPDGPDEQVVEISTFPLLDRVNRVVQVVEYIKEVTERIRLAERLEHARRLAELGEMAARVAHEVRNPLNAITGAAHYLSTEYSGDETLLKFTNLIQRQATRVNQVASDLLYVSKPLRTRFLPLQLNAVIDQSLDSLCEQFQGGRITVVRDLSPDLPLVQADELQVEQALQNLLRNAVEAMPMGGTLRIASALAAAGDFAEVRIQDTGSGIAEEHRGRIFQSFFTTKVKGTGLGLTIVQRVLRNHGGEITLEHPDAGGTAVLIRLPLTQEAGAASSSERTWPEHTGTPLP